MYQPRKKFIYKCTYGHVRSCSRSKGKMGDAVLCHGAARHAGAGNVTYHLQQEGTDI